MMNMFTHYTLAFLLVSLASSSAQDETKPNFILIMTDDQGMDDYGFRQPPLETPNLDKLMKDGVQFTRFYTGTACAPTRSQLMTGRHFLRTGTVGVGFGRDAPHLNEYMLGEALQDAGYVTGMVGKWNLGTSDAELPHRRGFNETWDLAGEELRDRGKYEHFNAPFTHNGIPHGIEPGWQVERVTDKALRFINRNKDEPFFLYIPYAQPHEPWLCRKELQEKYIEKGIGESYAMLLGMLEQMDIQVGRILEALERYHLSKNTIVIYFGDNGPTPKTRLLAQDSHGNFRPTGERYEMNDIEWAARNPTGLRAQKATGWENAVRNRLSFYCPARLNAKVVQDMTIVYDIFPTLLQLAGHYQRYKNKTGVPRLDGQSFQGLLFQDNPGWPQDREYLVAKLAIPANHLAPDGWYYRFTKEHSLRLEKSECALVSGHWVVVNEVGAWSLYDLSSDPGQENDLQTVLPEKFLQMENRFYSVLHNVSHDTHSWSNPVQVIGLPGIEHPYLEMCYMHRFKGRNRVSWFYTFFEEVGATQDLKVRVLESGTYNVILRTTKGVPVRTMVQFHVGEQKKISLLNKDSRMHNLGMFRFEEGDYSIGMTIVQSGNLQQLQRMNVFNLLLNKVSGET